MHITSPLRLSTLALLASLGFGAQAGPAAAGTASTYEQEVARCNSGLSQQDRATCLKEARNAHAEALRGRLDDHQRGTYDNTAVARCDRLPPADKTDCIDRMHGKGTASGSVEAGGIYRETVTVVPAAQPDNGAAASGTPAAPGDTSARPPSTPPMQPAR
jgi:hypothetical protein